MVFLLDENISFDVIYFLKSYHFKVEHVKLLGKSGIRNGDVHKLSVRLKAWIVTRDTDFLNREKITEHKTKGVIVIRLTDSSTKILIDRLKEFLSTYQNEIKKSKLIVIDDKRFIFFK